MASGQDAEVGRVARKRYWRATDARVVVDAWRRSGEKPEDFAERRGIHPRRLRRWVSALEEPAVPARFYAVRLVHAVETESRADAALELVLGEGLTIRVAPGFAAEDLARVLEVLGVGAGC